ncbi:hypothetical protein CgunFtcFv8_016335 [Champsocephalus gunnari]|uniref:Uncharacterized protein n=1 Tax=Champsocephalus gunnari TaxID=52237 RepID=A0AAN8CQH7_CHAGU|nr:hypothetical protein CgunFtcFv8_016335 [Champsocephalus gunnari]
MTISSLPDPADQPFSFSGVLSASLGRRHLFRPFHLSGALACCYGGNRERGGGGALDELLDPVPAFVCQA